MKEANYLVKTHGVKNMWRGNSANIMRIFPLSGIVRILDASFGFLK